MKLKRFMVCIGLDFAEVYQVSEEADSESVIWKEGSIGFFFVHAYSKERIEDSYQGILFKGIGSRAAFNFNFQGNEEVDNNTIYFVGKKVKYKDMEGCFIEGYSLFIPFQNLNIKFEIIED